jgi:prepilin peptidase CpaA
VTDLHLLRFPFPWALLALGLLVATAYDVAERRVPNWLPVGLLTSGLLARLLFGGAGEAAWGLAGAAAGLLLLALPYLRGWIGGGDVKLLGACGGWLAPQLLLYAVLLGALAAGLISLLYLRRGSTALRRQILTNLKLTLLTRSVPEMPEVWDRPLRLSPPLAPAIALGCVAAVCLRHVDYLVLYTAA